MSIRQARSQSCAWTVAGSVSANAAAKSSFIFIGSILPVPGRRRFRAGLWSRRARRQGASGLRPKAGYEKESERGGGRGETCSDGRSGTCSRHGGKSGGGGRVRRAGSDGAA